MLKYEIPDFAAFSEYFYRTDHHWNYLGSYRAYRELLPLLGCTDTPLEPTATETLGEFSGSKAAGTGLDIFSEPFTVYRFAYPEMTVTRNGETMAGRTPCRASLRSATAPSMAGTTARSSLTPAGPTGEICWSSANPMTTPF